MASTIVRQDLLGSVTECIYLAKQGESYAQQQLWERYLQSLLRLARSRLGGIVESLIDPEDIAIQAFHEFLAGVEGGKFAKLENRQDLWQILMMLTRRRSIDEKRRLGTEKRGQMLRSVSYTEAECAALVQAMATSEPGPDQVAEFSEQFEHRLAQLTDPKLRQIALRKLSGFSNCEIATQWGCSLRSIERKLSIIRATWKNETE